MSLDLVYFTGGPRERVLEAIVNEGHRITHVYANDPARWPKVIPTLEFAKRNGIPASIVANKLALSEVLEEVRGRICFSAGFNYLFPGFFLEAVRACINVHGSLLPRYKGARTLAWAIEEGETKSGITVHRVDAGMDTGDILLQRAFELSPFETTRSLARKTSELEPQVVVEALELFEMQEFNCAKPQEQLQLQEWPNRLPHHSELDPSLPLTQLVNKIRAADEVHYPAYFFHHGEKVCVKIWRPEKPDDESDLV
jgi:methionyl-tRNA formyltransferase